MTPLMAFAVIALSLGIVVAIAPLLGAAGRMLSPMLQRRRGTAQLDGQQQDARHGATARSRRVSRRSRRQSKTLRRARRY